MAEDTNKKSGLDENTEPANKDWEWDAKTPDAPIDAVDLSQLDIPQAAEKDEEISVEEEAVPATSEPGCCIICGEKLKNSPSELYCNVCREKFLKVNYGASHIILSIVMMFVAVIGIVAFSATSQITKNISDGEDHLKNNHIARALDSFNAVDSTANTLNSGFNAFIKGISTNFGEVNVFDAGTAANKKIAEIMVKSMTSAYEDREAFMALVESSFTEKELNSEKYADIKECYDFCKSMDTTANAIYEEWYAMLNERLSAFDENGVITSDGSVPTIDDIIAYLDSYAAKNPDAEPSTIDYYKVMTVYYEYASFGTVEASEMMGHLNNAYTKAGKFGYFYSDYYLSFAWECEDYDALIKVANEILEVNPANEGAYFYLTKAHSQLKEWDKASGICEELLKYNPDSLDYYTLKAEVLRRTGKFSEAVDVCKKGLKAGEDSELYRQESIAYMLNEEKDKALEIAKSAYESAYAASYTGGTISLEVLNTTALISYLCDEEKTLYNEIIEMLETEGYELEDSVKSVIKGDTTFEDLFTTGKGDI
ncbi:MAG: tetratricopeptide repeat protein [Clostridia bacterium]|nr:tetratricopeptide repeat protein [Clostridia bacterium]